jgi:hypothetical protein
VVTAQHSLGAVPFNEGMGIYGVPGRRDEFAWENWAHPRKGRGARIFGRDEGQSESEKSFHFEVILKEASGGRYKGARTWGTTEAGKSF